MTSPFDLAMTQDNAGPLHVISLEEATERYGAFVHQLLKKNGWTWPILRHAATDARAWPLRDASDSGAPCFDIYVDPQALLALEQGRRTSLQDLTRHEVGRALSHTRLWSQLVSHRDWAFQIIFEDDARLHPQAHDLMPAALCDAVGALPNDWDVLLLGGCLLETYQTYANYAHVRFFSGAHAYVVRKEAAWRLLSQAYPILEPLEYHMARKAIQTKLRIYALVPPLFVGTPTNKSAGAISAAPLPRSSPNLNFLRHLG